MASGMLRWRNDWAARITMRTCCAPNIAGAHNADNNATNDMLPGLRKQMRRARVR